MSSQNSSQIILKYKDKYSSIKQDVSESWNRESWKHIMLVFSSPTFFFFWKTGLIPLKKVRHFYAPSVLSNFKHFENSGSVLALYGGRVASWIADLVPALLFRTWVTLLHQYTFWAPDHLLYYTKGRIISNVLFNARHLLKCLQKKCSKPVLWSVLWKDLKLEKVSEILFGIPEVH